MTRAFNGHPPPRPWLASLRAILCNPRFALAYPGLAVLVGFVYALVLPTLTLGGGLELSYLRFLTPAQWLFAGGMSVSLPPLLLLDIYAWRHPACRRETSRRTSGLVGALLGLLPNALCCGPLIPTLLSILVSGTSLAAWSPAIQYDIGRFEPLLYLLAVALTWIAIFSVDRTLVIEACEGPGGNGVPR
jgi:hypothetical protein